MTNPINDNTNDVMKDIAAYTVPEQYDMTYEELKALIDISLKYSRSSILASIIRFFPSLSILHSLNTIIIIKN